MSLSGPESTPRSAGPTPEEDDLQLVERAGGGDVTAFESLYRRYIGQVHALCLRMVAEPVQAEILTQDVFVRAWRKLGTYRGRGAFGGWLRRLAVNVVIEDRRADARRSRRLEPFIDPEEGSKRGVRSTEDRLEGSCPTGELRTGLEGTEISLDLDRALRELPPGCRLVFVLHDVMGYPHREMAEMTGLAEGTLKAQLHRARRLLRRALSDFDAAG